MKKKSSILVSIVCVLCVLTSCGHTHAYKESVISPTCNTQGYTLHKCSCGAEYKDNITEALGHTYKQTIVKPTCTQKGYTLYTCEKCGNKYRDNETNALKHSYVGTITKPATTSSTGEKTYKCSVCGDTYTEIIPKINTDWKIEDVLDEFGDKTGRKSLIGTFYGTCRSSSSTTKRACTITAQVYRNDSGEFRLSFQKVYIGSSSSYMLDEAKSGSLTTKNSDGTKKKYSLLSGIVIPYNRSDKEPNADELVNDIKKNKQIECVLYAANSENTYTFTMNNADFTNILNKYLEN